MGTFPKIKKKVQAFLVGEEGKISKKSIIRAGIITGSIGLSSAIAAADWDYTSRGVHSNSTPSPNTHAHKLSHYSHGSHDSHQACQPMTC